MAAPQSDVRDNQQQQRYELEVDGRMAIAAYQPRGGAIAFTHTEVPAALEGHGIASRLIKGALADLRARDLKAIPLCAFVAAYFDRHPEDGDLLAHDAPG